MSSLVQVALGALLAQPSIGELQVVTMDKIPISLDLQPRVAAPGVELKDGVVFAWTRMVTNMVTMVVLVVVVVAREEMGAQHPAKIRCNLLEM